MDKVELQKLIGRRIKELRLEKGISQQMLASICDYDKSNMARIEAGRSNVTIGTILKLCNALEVSLYDFFDHENFKNF